MIKLLIIKHRKIIIITIILIVVFFIARKNWWRVKALIQPRVINTENGKTTVSPGREPYLQQLADKIYQDIYDTPVTGHTESLYTEANALSDVELLYLSRYYKRSLTSGVTIYSDLQSEWFALFGSTYDAVNALANHLSKIGER